ncbi:MAG TPA: L-histidine N(alpha)-methyltransferase [Acidimicrobiales bacterium]|nr:L-histidine N(alpha)-methyltransferase [Acidimicrobiales bacterium]
MSTIAPSIDVHLSGVDLRAALERDVRIGLSAPQKWLPPVWFYDDCGSQLFDDITRLPEYYLTRAERGLLEAHAPEITSRSGADTLVELGAGTCDKSRVLLDAMRAEGTLQRYVPLDVSDGTLWDAATALAADYPGLAVHAVVGDFHRHIDRVPAEGRRLVAFLGSTIGNLAPEERARFLFDLDCIVTHEDRLLLGTDLVKDRDRLLAAYDDSAGVTAAFNRNVLSVLNRELHASFDPARFEHVAVWNEAAGWIEMRLRSTVDQRVPVGDLGMDVEFEAGEDLLTEISAKFTRSGVEEELLAAGFVVDAMWEAPHGDFLLTLGRPYC